MEQTREQAEQQWQRDVDATYERVKDHADACDCSDCYWFYVLTQK